MEEKLKRNIVNKILKRIPAHINPIDYLVSSLQISRESVYRRMKGEVSFTLEDVLKLSSELGFSIDGLMYPEDDKLMEEQYALFNFRPNKTHEPQDTFFKLFSLYLKIKKDFQHSEIAEAIYTMNHIMMISYVHFDHLLKFYFYKWTHQMNYMPFKFRLSDVTVPEKVALLQSEIKSGGLNISNTTGLVDRYFLRNTILEIQYYYKRKLITFEELLLIQEDLFKYVDILEYVMSGEPDESGYKNDIYLCSLRVESTGMLIMCDSYEESHFWIYSGTHITTRDKKICENYKAWLNSLKKYSSLITGCNESLQTQFIDQQREYVENIANEKYTYE